MNQIATTDSNQVSLTAIARQTSSPALQIMLNPELFEKAKNMAVYLAGATGFVPPSIAGNAHAAFAVVVRALTWKLDPYAVASCTYQTPGGRVGYEGKLIQAILEASGKITGGVKYDYYGDWSKIEKHFKKVKKTNKHNTEYELVVPDWDEKDEVGVGVTVSAQIAGEAEPRKYSFDLRQAYPRNSTLWATDPKTQLGYAAVRRFASVAVPNLLMGVPFEGDVTLTGPEPVDVNPRPVRETVKPATPETVVEPETSAPPKFEADSAGSAEDVEKEIDRKIAQASGQADEEDLTPPPELDRRPKPSQDAAAWESEAKTMLKAIVKVGPEIKKWKEFVLATEDRRSLMKVEARAIWDKLQAHILAKEEALRR